jgi:hypothetical protein
MLYIASPYTHPNPLVRRARAHCAAVITAELMRGATGDWFFSPIPLGHEVAQHLPYEVADDHGFWMRWCRNALEEASALYLIPLPGWQESKGIAEELAYCDSKSLPVVYLDCSEWVRQLLLGKIPRPATPVQVQIYREWKELCERAAKEWCIAQRMRSWRWNWEVKTLGDLKEAHNG